MWNIAAIFPAWHSRDARLDLSIEPRDRAHADEIVKALEVEADSSSRSPEPDGMLMSTR